jgi:hypothetical protein
MCRLVHLKMMTLDTVALPPSAHLPPSLSISISPPSMPTAILLLRARQASTQSGMLFLEWGLAYFGRVRNTRSSVWRRGEEKAGCGRKEARMRGGIGRTRRRRRRAGGGRYRAASLVRAPLPCVCRVPDLACPYRPRAMRGSELIRRGGCLERCSRRHILLAASHTRPPPSFRNPPPRSLTPTVTANVSECSRSWVLFPRRVPDTHHAEGRKGWAQGVGEETSDGD